MSHANPLPARHVRDLDRRQLNRALLARQLLLERSRLGLVQALERVGGLQTQYAPSGYVGLWSRLAGFERSHLTRALERRRVIQATLMRATIHLVSARDYLLFSAGVRLARRDWWLRSAARDRRVDYERVASVLRSALSDGPRSRADLVAALEDAGHERGELEGGQMWLDMIRVPPSGTWQRRRADIFGLADDWLGENPFTNDQGLEHLVRRYLGGFGPAPAADIANWAGLPRQLIEATLPRLGLRIMRGPDDVVLHDLPRAPVPDPRTLAPVRFLPTWDANLLVHARRTGILPEEHRPRIFNTKNPQSVGTVLVDGSVRAIWRLVEGAVVVEPLEVLTRSQLTEVKGEADALTAFHGSERPV
jgi:hypothetical protein